MHNGRRRSGRVAFSSVQIDWHLTEAGKERKWWMNVVFADTSGRFAQEQQIQTDLFSSPPLSYHIKATACCSRQATI